MGWELTNKNVFYGDPFDGKIFLPTLAEGVALG